MTIRTMPGVVIAVVVFAAAPACRQAQASRATPAASRAVLLRLRALDHEVHRMQAADTHLARVLEKTAARIDSLHSRVAHDEAVAGHLKVHVGKVEGTAGTAAAHADAAAAQAAQLAAQLSVLEQRFDYHLKHDPGGH